MSATIIDGKSIAAAIRAEAREAAMQAFRANYLKELLDSHNGNVSKAARAAGVSRRTIHRWVAETESWNGEVPLDDSDD